MHHLPNGAPTRFDYVLGGMGLSLACGGVVGVASTVPLVLASSVASLVAAALLFVGSVGQF
ncbi:hypothetical protein [Halobellus clavatus]|jgi:hypothetical protein|uniref:Uncharacterized protein n=1 Tax=Halobellus clavatus TaxID=660517 RepID=A0A1H3GIF2_9EURY|nr:hypothetical protein [Halobellus clavatus]SDY02830.1 hypothetical protein SAMN04487946_105177 [Halobellus clavatus]